MLKEHVSHCIILQVIVCSVFGEAVLCKKFTYQIS